jgi:predicted RNA binding protein YcfA (HicA-like mRNA interferase family)
MPKKIRQLKNMLKKAGFSVRPGKGSHTVWGHPNLGGKMVTISGNDGDDAKAYQEKQVREAIKEAGGGT